MEVASLQPGQGCLVSSARRRLSPDFDARVMKAVQPISLTGAGRLVMSAYAVVAAVTTVWFMKDLGPGLVAAALVATLPTAAGTQAYARSLLARP